ncbi:MAG: universal stress protein [Halothiobacillaceae bacterium]|jgi:nucleotide-binding universal stress UspA family protein|nr:universal stress protein [Halothiobacillaceae bacterium]MDY0050756.1 universal stress protein [Halothiobacillaceae bacterium]
MEAHATLLVASDLSERAQPALARAAQLARSNQARLLVLHVIAEEPIWHLVKTPSLDPDYLSSLLSSEALDQLHLQLQSLGAVRPEQVEPLVVRGKPFVDIVRTARQHNAELIVVGAHGRHFLKDWFIGTTAERVVHKGDRPVLVVKRPDTETPYRQVLIATDFSDPARLALRAARRWAPDAEYVLAHAYDLWFEARLHSSGVDPQAIRLMHAEQEAALRSRLDSLAREEGLDPRRTRLEILRGHPGPTLVEAAERLNADLVVCGTQGAERLRQVLLGSVAEHLLRETPCDILAVRPERPDFELP